MTGTPATTATVGKAYVFNPSAADADGDTLVWSITGKPSSASFNVSTGALSWTPAAAATAANIVITVTDSKGAKASLPAFTIVASAPVVARASLSWDPPTQYTDGSVLPSAQIAGFRIYHGASASTMARIAEVDGYTTGMTVTDLAKGKHYFAVTAITITGAESGLSEVGSKTVL